MYSTHMIRSNIETDGEIMNYIGDIPFDDVIEFLKHETLEKVGLTYISTWNEKQHIHPFEFYSFLEIHRSRTK